MLEIAQLGNKIAARYPIQLLSGEVDEPGTNDDHEPQANQF
jgi:hypothetical protein